MKPTTLTKTRFVQALECPRKLDYARDARYRDQRSENEFMAMLAEGGHQVGALARLMFPEGRLIQEKSSEDQVAATTEALRADSVTLFEATIRHGNLLVRCDVLRKRGNDLQLIEVKAKGFDPAEGRFLSKRGHPILSAWRPYLYDVAYQAHVLALACPGLRVTPHLLLLDKSVRVQMDGLNSAVSVHVDGRDVAVTIDDSFDITKISPPVLRLVDVSEEIARIRAHPVEGPGHGMRFEDFVADVAGVLERGDSFPIRISAACKKCEYYVDPAEITDDVRSGWNACMTQAKAAPPTIARGDTVCTMYRLLPDAMGKLLLEEPLRLADVKEETFAFDPQKDDEIELGHRRYLQWQDATGSLEEPFVLGAALRSALGEWRWPLHFIDFETSRPALPYHAGRTPYDQILFQYSHHVLERDGRLAHRSQHIEVTPGAAPSLAVLRALRKVLSEDEGTVVHWWTHERTVLSDIQRQIIHDAPPYAGELLAFVTALIGGEDTPGRLQDLGKLVARTVYFPGTSGSSSIKKVLPAALRLYPDLRRHYGEPSYGTTATPSLNFSNWRWVSGLDANVRDPYELLDPLFADGVIQQTIHSLEEEDSGLDSDFVSNGGAALIAYDQLQKPGLAPAERQRLVTQLLRYCELDTLAMVMVYQALTGHGVSPP